MWLFSTKKAGGPHHEAASGLHVKRPKFSWGRSLCCIFTHLPEENVLLTSAVFLTIVCLYLAPGQRKQKYFPVSQKKKLRWREITLSIFFLISFQFSFIWTFLKHFVSWEGTHLNHLNYGKPFFRQLKSVQMFFLFILWPIRDNEKADMYFSFLMTRN